MEILSAEEFKKRYGSQIATPFKPQQAQGSSFGQRLKQNFSAGINQIKSASQDINSGNPLRFAEGALKAGAGAVNTAFSPIAAATQPVIEPTIGRAVNYTADKISNNSQVQQFATSKIGEIVARITEDLNNLNTIASAVSVPQAGAGVASATQKTTANVARGLEEISTNISNGVSKINNFAPTGTLGALKDSASLALENVKQIPNKIGVNLTEKRLEQQAITKLPTPTARNAAVNGLDIMDVKTLYNIPKVQVQSIRKLTDTVQKFARGETKTDPIEVVGKPIVTRLKELEAARSSIGKKLGEVSKSLGVVTTKETIPAVFNKLKKVSGLNGLRLTKNGKLDFKNTVLTTLETASDRKSIQAIFDSATAWGNGTRKHLLRQELFETLGGKKRSLTNLTATQEKAYQAVRSALSDVLETKSPTYKKLSNEYRRIVEPLEELRKRLKVDGETDDIMDLSAGLLARRITSTAQSNPQIRALLNKIDKATAKVGKTRLSIETLQDVYNILEKYYDIAPKTGYQAQTRQAIEKSGSGLLGAVYDKAMDFAGETPAVRQKALEDVLKEILK